MSTRTQVDRGSTQNYQDRGSTQESVGNLDDREVMYFNIVCGVGLAIGGVVMVIFGFSGLLWNNFHNHVPSLLHLGMNTSLGLSFGGILIFAWGSGVIIKELSPFSQKKIPIL